MKISNKHIIILLTSHFGPPFAQRPQNISIPKFIWGGIRVVNDSMKYPVTTMNGGGKQAFWFTKDGVIPLSYYSDLTVYRIMVGSAGGLAESQAGESGAVAAPPAGGALQLSCRDTVTVLSRDEGQT